jgi:hypothetical protein
VATRVESDGAGETVAGFLAAAAITVALVALVYRPARLAPPAILVALVANGIGGRHARLAAFALVLAALCFVAGMTIAVATETPIF